MEAEGQGMGVAELRRLKQLEEDKEKIEGWRVDYKERRPHGALNDQTPLEVIEDFDQSQVVEKQDF